VLKQLNPPIPQYCLGDNFFPRGSCIAYFITDYGIDFNLHWLCCFDKGGGWYSIPNQLIRGLESATLGRTKENNTAIAKMID
jgi:hypothetical protein